jgi:hypothetical protein
MNRELEPEPMTDAEQALAYTGPPGGGSGLLPDVEAEVADLAVLHLVVLPLEP